MSGKALFKYDPSLFQDDEQAADEKFYEEIIEEEEESKEEEKSENNKKLFKNGNGAGVGVNEDLFGGEAVNDDEEPNFDDDN